VLFDVSLSMRSALPVLFVFLLFFQTSAQTDTSLHSSRVLLVSGGTALIATSSLLLLNQAWYTDYPRTSFHSFNDGKEWLQMDKAGHIMTSYYVGRLGAGAFRWSGMREKPARYWGGSLGFLYLTGIEILDGYSSGWGFSGGDMIANTAGAGAFIIQDALWKEQRITFKFSVHSSEYAQYNPSLLGSTTAERILKDYNGQTYWMSVNPGSFMNDASKFPKWINVAFGYGAEGMVRADPNIDSYSRYRKYFLSLDIDLTRLPVKKKWMKTVLNTIGFIKVPFPALELSRNQLYFRPLYF
jgi:hypothetical protein